MLLALWPLFEIRSADPVSAPEIEVLKEAQETEILVADVGITVIQE